MIDRLASWWERLTEPAPAIQDLEQRRQARLLAGLLLIIMFLGMLSGVIQLLTVPGFLTTFQFIFVGIMLLAVAYFLARSRFFTWAVLVAILVPLLVVLNVVVNNPRDAVAFAFLLMGVLLGSILLSWRQLVVQVVGYLVSLLVLPLVTNVTFAAIIGPLFFLIIGSGLVLLAYQHRDRLAKDRQRELATANTRMLREIGERSQAEAARQRLLRDSQAQARELAHILAAIQEGIVLLTAEGRVQLANPLGETYLALLATEAEGVVLALGGRPLQDLLKPVDGGSIRHELGQTARPEQSPSGPTRLFELWATPMPAGAAAAGWVLVLRDITDARTQQLYQQAQERLATVGQLAAGVSHDLNNIMAVVTLYSQLVLKRADLDEHSREQLQTVQEQAQRAASLINQILDFSRRSVMDRMNLNMVTFVKELTRLMVRTLPEHIDLNFQYGHGDYFAFVDPTRLQQVLMNVMVNARDALPEGGRLDIRLDHHHQAAGQRPPLPDLPAGEWLQLTLADNGLGIDPAALPHVFEPFFTTKGIGEGTGLGLAQAYGIIKQHDGYIDIMSRPGQGTTVAIFLPAATPVAAAPPSKAEAVSGAGECILVVEDEPATRAAVRDILLNLGYAVEVAADGQQALALLSELGAAVDLVLSDVVMPGMGGQALLAQMRADGWAMPVVFMTGYPLEDDGRHLLEQGIVAWLAKPFGAEDIAAVVHEALRNIK